MHRWHRIRPILLAILVGTAGGALFQIIGTPLPWILGAMFFTLVTAISVGGIELPRNLRNRLLPVIGVLLGGTFTPDILDHLTQWAAAVPVAVLYLVTCTWLGLLYFRRIGGLDRITAFFASTPGGLSELTLIGAAMGGDLRAMAIIHAMRVVITVFSIPFGLRLVAGDMSVSAPPLVSGGVAAFALLDVVILTVCGVVGYVVGGRLHLPAGHMLGPLLLSAAAHMTGLTTLVPPVWLVAAVQVVIGAAIGVRFTGLRVREITGILVIAIGWSLIMVMLAVLFAAATGPWLGIDLDGMVLALAPGGLAEMTLVALALGTDVAFVATLHLVRIALVIAGAPMVFRLLGWKQPPPSLPTSRT